MAEAIDVLQPGDPALGRPCMRCRRPLEAGEEAVVCPRCKSPHHLRCWREHGGCARRGCPQLAEVVVDRPQTEDRLHAPRRRGAWWVAAAALFLLVAGGLIYRAARPASGVADGLTVMLPATEQRELLTEIVQSYNAQSAVEPVSALWVPAGPLYEEKLLIMFAARQAPDVVLLPLDRIRLYAKQGALLPLTDLVSDPQGMPAAYPPGRLDLGRVDGIPYGLPNPGLALWFAVTSQTDQPQAAIEFLRFVVGRIPVAEGIDDEAGLPYWPPLPPLPSPTAAPPAEGVDAAPPSASRS
ncbi:MAG TPA: RING finger protein [Limnochordia bacterium]